MDPLYSYLFSISSNNLANRQKCVDDINSIDQFLERQSNLKRLFADMLGIEAIRKSQVETVQCGIIEFDDYVIEKLILVPEPDYYIPVNLYRPLTVKKPAPAVLTPVGHYNEGKSVKPYQIICASLARKGCIALVFDPIGQGERDMFGQTDNIDDYYCVIQHSLAGNLAYLLGESISRFFILDCIYAIDYLMDRSDVDTERIGCVGHSGGATATAFLSSLDARIKAAMSVHFITKYEPLIKNVLHGGDPDQSLFGLLSSGIDMEDYLWMTLPRPYAINAGIQDFFPIEGARQVYSNMKKFYDMFGISDRLSIVEVDCGHELNPEVRANIYKWACIQFDLEADSGEQHTEVLSALKLSCFGSGTLLPGTGDNPFTRYMSKNLELEASREKIRDLYRESSLGAFTKEVSDRLIRLLSLDKPLPAGNAGIEIKLHRNGHNGKPLVVAIDFEGCLREDGSLFRSLSDMGFDIATVEPAGFHITRNSPIEQRHIYNEDYKITYHAFINGLSILGMRVRNCLDTISELEKLKLTENGIIFIGSGQGGLIGTLLSPLCKAISAVISVRALSSYSLLFENKNYITYPSNIINGIMKHFDISTIAAASAPKPMLIINPADEMNRTISDINRLDKIFSFTYEVYSRENCINKLSITNSQNVADTVSEFLRMGN